MSRPLGDDNVTIDLNQKEKFNGIFYGKISAQPHTIVKQICFPNGNVLFLSLFSLSKNWMHNVVWGCAEILPILFRGSSNKNSHFPLINIIFIRNLFFFLDAETTSRHIFLLATRNGCHLAIPEISHNQGNCNFYD